MYYWCKVAEKGLWVCGGIAVVDAIFAALFAGYLRGSFDNFHEIMGTKQKWRNANGR